MGRWVTLPPHCHLHLGGERGRATGGRWAGMASSLWVRCPYPCPTTTRVAERFKAPEIPYGPGDESPQVRILPRVTLSFPRCNAFKHLGIVSGVSTTPGVVSMGNRSIRDEKQGRAGAPGAGSLFGKKQPPPRKETADLATAQPAAPAAPKEDKSLRRQQLDRIEKSYGI